MMDDTAVFATTIAATGGGTVDRTLVCTEATTTSHLLAECVPPPVHDSKKTMSAGLLGTAHTAAVNE